MNRIKIYTYYLLFISCLSDAIAMPSQEVNNLIKEGSHNIYHVIKDMSLLETLKQISKRSGIVFMTNPQIQNDKLNCKVAAENRTEATKQLLHGYNYTIQYEKAIIKTVTITGQNGSGNKLNDYKHFNRIHSKDIKNFSMFKTGSIFPLKLPLAEIRATPLKSKINLNLPIGQYSIVHDNIVKHENGTSTWIGYLEDEGQAYRIYLSEGKAGLMGNLFTPDGVYNIDTMDGQTVLVDLKNSGFVDVGIDADQAHVGPSIASPFSGLADTISTKPANTSPASLALTNPLGASRAVEVDVMVLYTAIRQTAAYARQQILLAIDRSNQAFMDSKIALKLRLVHARQTSYPEGTSNNEALYDLANDRGAFVGTSAIRNQYGADIVMLFRPLYGKTSGSCGLTYVGFADGSPANPKAAFGTVNNGYSKDTVVNAYCEPKTFTHEVGHIFGNVHDHSSNVSPVPGRFPYSYAWGVAGKFGTIMSYKKPSLMLFASPLLKTNCKGQPCGYAAGDTLGRASDQSRTINETARIVSGFRAKKTNIAVIR